MDRRLQRFFAVALLLIVNITYSQCKDGIKIVNDTIKTKRQVYICKNVKMSPAKFSYYYQVDKQFKILKDSLPELEKLIHKNRQTNDSLISNLELHIKTIKEQKGETIESLKEIEDLNTLLEVENLQLTLSNKSNKKIYGIGGIIIGTLIAIIIRR